MSLVLVTLLGLTVVADGEIDLPVDDVQAALVDYAAHPSMLGAITESEVLERVGNALYVHQRFRLPLLRDREATLRVTWKTEGTRTTTRFRVDESRAPAKADGVVRLEQLDGQWLLEPTRDGLATRVRFAVDVDFGGDLPKWMVRDGFAHNVPRLYEGLRRLAREEQRKRARAACPSAVPGARTDVADAGEGVQVVVSSVDERARQEIRRRAVAYVEARDLGLLDDAARRGSECPGMVPRTFFEAEDTADGVMLTVRPIESAHTPLLRAIAHDQARHWPPPAN